MPDANAVPIPQGATIGDPNQSSAGVPIPQGATIGEQAQTQQTQQTPPSETHPNDSPMGATDRLIGEVGTGAAKGLGQTVAGVGSLINKIPVVGEALAPKEGVEALDKMSQTHGAPETVGSGLEGLAEFAAGDEALEGIAKGAKIIEMAKKFPAVAQALEMAEKSKTLSKIMTSAGKGAIVGGTQGAVKGAAEGKGVEEGLAGAAGGGVGGAAGETASEVAGILGKRFGVGTTAAEDATRGAKPGKRNYRFADDFQKAAPRIDAEAQTSKPETLEDWADATDAARQKLWATEIQPMVDQYKEVPLDGQAIADNIRAKIPEAMKKYSPEQAKIMEDLANRWVPGGQMGSDAIAVPAHNTFVGDAEEALEHYNALVAKTGYWTKTPSERAALLKSDGELAGNLAVGDAIRDEFYNKLGTLEQARVQGQPTYPAQGVPTANIPARNIQALKQEYGALRNVGNELRGQVNVQGRQSPISLKEAIGLMTGLGRGGLTGGLIASVGPLDRAVNAPEKLISRAVQKAARPGEEGAVAKTLQKGREVAGNVGAQAGAAIPRVYFQASDGSTHSIPADQLHEALKIDPKLTIINQ